MFFEIMIVKYITPYPRSTDNVRLLYSETFAALVVGHRIFPIATTTIQDSRP